MADFFGVANELFANETEWCNETTSQEQCIAHGNGGALGTGNTPCHRAGKWALCNICELPNATYYPNTKFPSFWDTLFGHTPTGHAVDANPTGFALTFIKFNHILPFITGFVLMWMISYKLETLQSRIGNNGVFYLNLAIVFWSISDMCEFANHELLLDWNMCYDTSSNVTFLFFYIFNGGGNALLALGLRKKGTSFFRKLTFSLDGLNLVFDWLLIIVMILVPIAWYNPHGWKFPFRYFHGNSLNQYKGRSVAGSAFIYISSLSAFAVVGRIWINLGPIIPKVYGKYFLLSIVAAFSPLVGVFIDVVMVKSPYQWWHGLLAMAFGVSQIFVTLCVFLAVPAAKTPAAAVPIGEREHLIKGGV